MTFTKLNLHPKLLEAISVCGYTKPTPVQVQAIPNILSGKDVVASAQTGTGKTAAYVLPCLQLLMTNQPKNLKGKPRVLILAPTRELAGQITKVIGKYGKFVKLNIASFVGGMPYHKQLRELSRPIDIIIATPGRLMDHMRSKGLDLSHIEMLIVDEADRMLDMGFIDDIKTIVQVTPKSRQTLLFSATVDDKLMSIMKNLLKDPVRINISQDRVDTNLIQQLIHVVADLQGKKQLLDKLLTEENIYKAVIFAATKRDANKLALQLCECGHLASAMHGDLKQSVRNRTLAQFREGAVQFLVATDVAARGIDVTDISHVINYDLPRSPEDYVHRIGRTGRAGKTGIAISMALRSESRLLQSIEQYISEKLSRIYAEGVSDRPEYAAGPRRSFGRGRGRSSGGNGQSFERQRSPFRGQGRSTESQGRSFAGGGRSFVGQSKSFEGNGNQSERLSRSFGGGQGKLFAGKNRPFEGGARPARQGRSFAGQSKPFEGNGNRSERPARSFANNGQSFGGQAKPADRATRPFVGSGKPLERQGRPAGSGKSFAGKGKPFEGKSFTGKSKPFAGKGKVFSGKGKVIIG